MTIDKYISEIPYFADLDESEKQEIKSLCQITEGESGEFLSREGQKVDCLYFITTGKAAILKRRGTE